MTLKRAKVFPSAPQQPSPFYRDNPQKNFATSRAPPSSFISSSRWVSPPPQEPRRPRRVECPQGNHESLQRQPVPRKRNHRVLAHGSLPELPGLEAQTRSNRSPRVTQLGPGKTPGRGDRSLGPSRRAGPAPASTPRPSPSVHLRHRSAATSACSRATRATRAHPDPRKRPARSGIGRRGVERSSGKEVGVITKGEGKGT